MSIASKRRKVLLVSGLSVAALAVIVWFSWPGIPNRVVSVKKLMTEPVREFAIDGIRGCVYAYPDSLGGAVLFAERQEQTFRMFRLDVPSRRVASLGVFLGRPPSGKGEVSPDGQYCVGADLVDQAAGAWNVSLNNLQNPNRGRSWRVDGVVHPCLTNQRLLFVRQRGDGLVSYPVESETSAAFSLADLGIGETQRIIRLFVDGSKSDSVYLHAALSDAASDTGDYEIRHYDFEKKEGAPEETTKPVLDELGRRLFSAPLRRASYFGLRDRTVYELRAFEVQNRRDERQLHGKGASRHFNEGKVLLRSEDAVFWDLSSRRRFAMLVLLESYSIEKRPTTTSGEGKLAVYDTGAGEMWPVMKLENLDPDFFWID